MCFARADDFAAMQFHRQMRGSFLFGLCIGVLLAAAAAVFTLCALYAAAALLYAVASSRWLADL